MSASAAAPENAVEVRDLHKTYGGKTPKTALTKVSLDVPRGSFFGLLGPNGAGKSTLINIMAGLVNRTSGTVRLWGHDIVDQPRQARMAIGVVPQELNLDAFFTPRELLEVQAGLYGVPKGERRTMDILDLVGLADKADSYARTLSGGMRRRLLVAKAMVHAPPILVLDEPTAGVDIELRRTLWEQINKLNAAGVTILLTTHYLEEAETLCDRIAIIDKGTVVANEPKDTLMRRLDMKTLRLDVDRDLEAVPTCLEPFNAELDGPRRIVIRYRAGGQRVDGILNAVSDCGVGVTDLSTEEADLEDIFLQLTGTQAAAAEAAAREAAGPAG